MIPVPSVVALATVVLPIIIKGGQSVLESLEDPELPPLWNVPMPTMGGKVFWKTIADVDGWRVQQNKVFGNCRILDPNNVRRAWGGINAMGRIFQQLAERQ
ncbi:MAG: hypothetical protein LBU65_05075 [Planctomycetaceae bacterium]|jgi:hypothetical protein|nr:hypothetical protein [Planctomycetaceae bacterium]